MPFDPFATGVIYGFYFWLTISSEFEILFGELIEKCRDLARMDEMLNLS